MIEAPTPVPSADDTMGRESFPASAKVAEHIRPSGAGRDNRGRRLWRLGRWTLLLSLIGLNAWWFWLGSRPVVGLDTIATWIERDRDGDAEQALRRRLTGSPHDGQARALLAKLMAKRHDMLGCARELHRVPFWWPDKEKWLLMEAGAFKELGRMSDAESAWKALIEDDPFHPVQPRFATAAVRDLLELCAVEGRWDEAVKLIWQAYDRTDDRDERGRLLNMRIRTELDRIVPSVAAAKMENYLAADPQDWEARRGLAKAKLALNLPEEARRLLETCLRERPEDHRCWADYLDLLHNSGDLNGLREAVARLPEPVAEYPAVLTQRARLLERDRRWAEAAALYHRILQVRPFERETYYRLSLVEDRLGQHETARLQRERWQAMSAARTELNAAYQKVLDLHRSAPDSSEYHAAIRRLARVCETLGWSRDAEGWAQLAPPA